MSGTERYGTPVAYRTRSTSVHHRSRAGVVSGRLTGVLVLSCLPCEQLMRGVVTNDTHAPPFQSLAYSLCRNGRIGKITLFFFSVI